MKLLYSILERALQRGVSGALAIVSGVFVEPRAFGLYSVGIAVLTAAQVVTDTSFRQQAVVLRTPSERARLSSRAVRSALVSMPVLVAVLMWLTVAYGDAEESLWLLPLALIPLVTVAGTRSFIELQVAGRFADITRASATGAALALAVALPLLVATRHPAALVLQFLGNELITSLLLRRRAHRLGLLVPIDRADDGRRASVRDVVATNLVGWLQSQAERLVALTVSTAATVGSFTYATAVARLVGDVIVAGFVGVARPSLAAAETAEARRGVLQGLMLSLALVMTASAFAVMFAVIPIMDRLLQSVWDPALAVVPVLLVAMCLTSLSWMSTAALLVEGAARRLRPLNALVVVGAIMVGMSATWGLDALCWAVLVREVVLTPVRLVAARHVMPALASAYWAGSVVLTGLAAVFSPSIVG